MARDGTRPGPRPTRSAVLARHAMVATSQPLCAQIGLDVLRAGGHAVDAAIATNAALGLMEPTSCGIGGDLFALVWDNAARRLVGLNGSGRSSRSLSLQALRQRVAGEGSAAIPMRGGLSVSVPGAVDGWFALHERFGRLPMASLLAPAIDAAREGFPVSRVIAEAWRRAERIYTDFEGFRRTFLPDGRAPREGELFRNPDLADTYERIAAGGVQAFTGGELGGSIVDCVRAAGGVLEAEDLQAHASEWVEPIGGNYRDHRVWELPPNGQGLAALQMLRLLERHDLPSMGFPSTDALHLMIEAKKLAYEDRARLYADPDFARVPVAELLSDEYTARRAALIDPGRAALSIPVSELVPPAGDTVYLTIADAEGNLASWIQSNYMGFGSGLVPTGRGFCLQNRGCLFHLDDDHANVYAPGKRPFHTIIPAMVTRDGTPVLSFGVMGGAMQPMGHVQIVANMFDFGMDVQQAGDAPRWRHDGSPEPTGGRMTDGGTVYLEPGLPAHVIEGLAWRGHRLTQDPVDTGGYQGIAVDHPGDAGRRVYRGGSEPRKDGAAVGW